MAAFMTRTGYSDNHPVLASKPPPNLTFAVEMLLVGYKGGIGNCLLTFSHLNPLFRDNLLFGLQVGSKLEHVGEEEEVSIIQNVPHVAPFIAPSHCKPGSSALVIGAGSGSEVVGLARVGVQVVRGADAAPDRGDLISGQGDEAGGERGRDL